ncbi:MAG: tRNA (guanine26-N2/guanine27-N2)-dimethyltransferase [Archaeoglobaceae archaeon]|nr:tRNA (guanine26-N2/guanine27-N2)-dimethyltransferase [Archaeoglobaceae archaeon]MDK2877049.1 tRNA (guanine26-N2/guanine27-N2)-dimethyltransferase [Archaeoglobaceae archaeon]
MIVEGKAKIFTDGIFYNPRMKFCRDLDMLVFAELKKNTVLDAFSATGVRGIRAMLEAEREVVFNDANPKAVEVIKKNLQLNGLSAEVYCKDATLLMRESSFRHIDIDPYGSPANYIESACNTAEILSVTATDLEALCCKGSAGMRKYSVVVSKTDTPHETGLRILLGFIARTSARFEKKIEPIAAWTKEHYYRVHLRMKRSTSQSLKMFENLGFLVYCQNCLRKSISKFDEIPERICKCGGRNLALGPLWLGDLKDGAFLEKIISRSEGEHKKFLLKIAEEVNSPIAYDIQKICSKLGRSVPPTNDLVEKLRTLGFKASPVHYCGHCIKTDADLEEIEKLLRA